MTKPLADLSDDDLVTLFSENCIAQDEASWDATLAENSSEFDEAVSGFKELYQTMSDIDTELEKRGPSSRLVLAKLYDHPNLQVRLQAARVSLAVAPVEASPRH